MIYITVTEFYGFVVKPEVVKLTEGTGGEPDMEVLEEINRTAAAELEGYLRGLYRLPLPEPAEPTIRAVMGELMRFYLRTRRNDQNVAESVFRLYQITIGRLKDIQTKKIILSAPALAGDGEGTVLGGTVQSWTPTQKFKSHFTGFDGLQIIVIGLTAAFLVSCGTSRKTAKSSVLLDVEQKKATITEMLSAGSWQDDLCLDFRVVETADTSGSTRRETTGTLRRRATQETRQQQTRTTDEETRQQQTETVDVRSDRVYQSPWLWVALTVAGLAVLVVLACLFKNRLSGFVKSLKHP